MQTDIQHVADGASYVLLGLWQDRKPNDALQQHQHCIWDGTAANTRPAIVHMQRKNLQQMQSLSQHASAYEHVKAADGAQLCHKDVTLS